MSKDRPYVVGAAIFKEFEFLGEYCPAIIPVYHGAAEKNPYRLDDSGIFKNFGGDLRSETVGDNYQFLAPIIGESVPQALLNFADCPAAPSDWRPESDYVEETVIDHLDGHARVWRRACEVHVPH